MVMFGEKWNVLSDYVTVAVILFPGQKRSDWIFYL